MERNTGLLAYLTFGIFAGFILAILLSGCTTPTCESRMKEFIGSMTSTEVPGEIQVSNQGSVCMSLIDMASMTARSTFFVLGDTDYADLKDLGITWTGTCVDNGITYRVGVLENREVEVQEQPDVLYTP